jgi:hypothetical protein
MAERRSYRTESTEPETPTPPREERKEAPKKKYDSGSGDSKYLNITGLFPTASGKADTVFLKEEHCEKLRSLKPGDVLGVNMNGKTGRLALWAIPNKEGE